MTWLFADWSKPALNLPAGYRYFWSSSATGRAMKHTKLRVLSSWRMAEDTAWDSHMPGR